MLYADDLFLKSETIKGLGNKFIKWKEAFENKGMKINLGKTKVMVSRKCEENIGEAVEQEEKLCD